MRGKVFVTEFVIVQIGITPAYAGKRQTARRWKLHSQDHPRLCGEKPTGNHMDSNRVGSPPPMRGKGR